MDYSWNLCLNGIVQKSGILANPIGFDIPGGWLQICTKKDTYPDGTEFVGVGILPDIEIQETVSSFLSKAETGVDNSNATNKAVEVLKIGEVDKTMTIMR